MEHNFFDSLATQLKSVRDRVDKAHADAEQQLEAMETRPGITPEELEEQTRLLERLESLLECLDEAMQHCDD